MILRMLFAFCALLCCLPAPTTAMVLTVRPDGNGDVPTIQAAIDSVAAVGDTITLADGLYTGLGNRDLNSYEKMFVLMSQSGDPTACIIDLEGDASERHWGFTFSGDG